MTTLTRADKIIHKFCAKCGQDKEPNSKLVHEECRGPGPFTHCANCGQPKEPNSHCSVHDECLCR